MSDSYAHVSTTDPIYVPIQVAVTDPRIQPLVGSYNGFHHLMRKHCRRLVNEGALIKRGRSWAVSISRAPSVIEAIYREQTLAALDR